MISRVMALARAHENRRHGGPPLAAFGAVDCAGPCEHGRRNPPALAMRCIVAVSGGHESPPAAGHKTRLRRLTKSPRGLEKSPFGTGQTRFPGLLCPAGTAGFRVRRRGGNPQG